MPAESTDDRSLNALILSLDEALESASADPEDVEARFRLVRPLERAVAQLPETPPVSEGTPGERIARLLWFKLHPQHTDLDAVLGRLRDDDPLTRLTAVEALQSAIEGDPSAWSGTLRSRRAGAALEEQRMRETSPVIAYQSDLLLQRLAKLSRARRPTPASRPANPYAAGPVIHRKDRFFGREDALRAIRHVLGAESASRSIVLQGARRTGKTSLLYRLKEDALGTGFVPVYIDLQGMAGQTLAGFLRSLMAAIEIATPRRPGGPPDVPAPLEPGEELEAFQSYVGSVVERIAPDCLVLLLDEYEVLRELIGNVAVARHFQSLLERHRSLFYVFAGSQKVEALKEKNFMLLLDNARYLKVTYLRPDEARRLITEPSRDHLAFPDEVIDAIQTLCAGHPFYTQLLCYNIFDLAYEQGRVTSQHVEEAVQRFVETPSPHLVLGWNGLGLHEKIVLSSLAELQRPSDRWVSSREVLAHLRDLRYPIHLQHGEIQQTLGTLRELDWVVKQKGERLFQFSLGLIVRWVAEHRSVWEVLEEYQRGLATRVARIGRRMIGTTIDWVLLTIVLASAGGAGLLPTWALPLIVVLYYVALIIAIESTLGMATSRVKVVTEAGSRLRPGRAVLAGALLSCPFALIIGSIALVEYAHETPGVVLLAAGVLLALGHVATLQFSKSNRGLLDRLAHVVVVAR